jgi:phosphatidylethanolamine/phosphatidyl-N-methylethanolamine N-methyltransferase
LDVSVIADLAFFLKQAVLQPKQTSSLVPSSRHLARAMARVVGPDTGKVVEFGPGTGRITDAILEQGVRPQDLTLFEMNVDFAEALRQKYPLVTTHVCGAQMVSDHMATDVGAVISGLPLLSMPRPLRRAIVKGAFSVLRRGGLFVQFTYGAKPPLSPEALTELGLRFRPLEKVWRNFPPAQVYVLTRQAD